MTTRSAAARPFRVLIVGSGPSGFYSAAELLRRDDVEVDMVDRLATPWGLVRSGVAPDHPRIKSVTRKYDVTAADERFRFFGGVTYGEHVTREQALARYDAVVYAVGAETDRPLDIPGADLPGVWPAAKFVGWYNAHPDHCDHDFDLRCDRAVVIGNGNVAIDVARMLCLPRDDLAVTDIAEHALDVLECGAPREIQVVGRRGPVQAAFTTPELRELGELTAADVAVAAEDLELDPHSAAELAAEASPTVKRNVELLREFAQRPQGRHDRRIQLRFLLSPVEIVGRDRVEGVVLERNRLVVEDGRVKAVPTGEREVVEAGLVFTSIGYSGRPLPGVPFDHRAGVIPNVEGIVEGGKREYVVGWIKRGPSGIIGTNKKDAKETVSRLLEHLIVPRSICRAEAEEWLHRCQPDLITQEAWDRIDRHERERGEAAGRPRAKLVHMADFLDVGTRDRV